MSDEPDRPEKPRDGGEEMDAEERAYASTISPHFRRMDFGPASPTPAQIIAIFADRVNGWQIDVADRLIKSDEHSGFAVLAIVMSYFEMIGKHLTGYEGTGAVGEHFRAGFDSVFQEVDPAERGRFADRLYKGVRNGLYHDAITTSGIVLAREPDDRRILAERATVDDAIEVVVNPELLVARIRTHFAAYVAALLDPSNAELREAFLRRFLAVDRGETPVPGPPEPDPSP
jgi:hypothetical protein